MGNHSIREHAIQDLKAYGIRNEELYLIDIIPLIEMIWADGMAQKCEVDILHDYVEKSLKRINAMAGHEIISKKQAAKFIDRFLENRPSPKLLEILRAFVSPIYFSSTDTNFSDTIKNSILQTCLDIAASCTTEYPYDFRDRFNADEKQTFFEILEALESSKP